MLDTYVLVVDDNPETLHLLGRALKGAGFHVRTAASVFRALEGLHDGSPPPALIVTDLVMPQTTGWDFLRHLRTDPALQTVPVIVITGADPGDSTELAEVVLEKPIDLDEVVQTVRRLLSRTEQT